MMKWYISEIYGIIVFLLRCAADRQNTALHPQKLFYVQTTRFRKRNWVALIMINIFGEFDKGSNGRNWE